MFWNHWWKLVCQLRSACARTRTLLWMALCLAGIATRKDLQGGTSIVRALELAPTPAATGSWTSSTAPARKPDLSRDRVPSGRKG